MHFSKSINFGSTKELEVLVAHSPPNQDLAMNGNAGPPPDLPLDQRFGTASRSLGRRRASEDAPVVPEEIVLGVQA